MTDTTEIEVVSADALTLITKAEIDTQISTAKAFPRSVTQSIEKAVTLATLNQDVAESCTYALPRGGKNIEGPSVRLAEIVASSFGNIRCGARVIANDGKTITAQGICHDLETNNCVTVEVKRSILQHEYKHGQKTGNKITMNEDMQVVTGNAACAIAFRNAVFKVIPAALIDTVYTKVKAVAKGDESTLVERRKAAIEYFNGLGVKDDQICETLGIKKIDDIDLDKLQTLTGFRSAIKNGDSTAEQIFAPKAEKEPLTDLENAKAAIELGTATFEQLNERYNLSDIQKDVLLKVEPPQASGDGEQMKIE